MTVCTDYLSRQEYLEQKLVLLDPQSNGMEYFKLESHVDELKGAA